MASRTDALKVVAAVGLASLVKGEEANNRDVADNFGRDRRLYQDESWYHIPDPAMNGQQPPPMMYEEPPMHNAYVETPPMHYNQPMENLPMHQNPPMHGGASWWQGTMPEAKGGKEHGSEMVSNGWWEPAWQEAAKASKTHNEGAASGWWQAAPEKVHVPEASGWWEAGSAKSEKVHHPEPSWGWWEAGSAKAEKSGKSKSPIKTSKLKSKQPKQKKPASKSPVKSRKTKAKKQLKPHKFTTEEDERDLNAYVGNKWSNLLDKDTAENPSNQISNQPSMI